MRCLQFLFGPWPYRPLAELKVLPQPGFGHVYGCWVVCLVMGGGLGGMFLKCWLSACHKISRPSRPAIADSRRHWLIAWRWLSRSGLLIAWVKQWYKACDLTKDLICGCGLLMAVGIGCGRGNAAQLHGNRCIGRMSMFFGAIAYRQSLSRIVGNRYRIRNRALLDTHG